MENPMNKFNPLKDFPWERLFKGQNMQNGSELTNIPGIDLSWIEGYIQDMMSKAIPNYKENAGNTAGINSRNTSFNYNIFETHDYMITRVKVPEDVYHKNVRVWFDINQLTLTGLSNNRSETIRLPFKGRYTGSQGYYKDDYLEVRIPKDNRKNLKEIDVKYL